MNLSRRYVEKGRFTAERGLAGSNIDPKIIKQAQFVETQRLVSLHSQVLSSTELSNTRFGPATDRVGRERLDVASYRGGKLKYLLFMAEIRGRQAARADQSSPAQLRTASDACARHRCVFL